MSAAGPSTGLWATASKDWTIPPKKKPGRKPKVVTSPPKDEEEVDSKGRRVQNRAAQRAFRERKQSQLAELQARVEAYEQGDIERNVALQTIAKRLKEENDKLRAENQVLKDRVALLERPTPDTDKKRRREESPTPRERPRKRTRVIAATTEAAPDVPAPVIEAERSQSVMSFTDSSLSMASSPGSVDTSDGPPSPASFEQIADMPLEDQTPLTTLDFSKQSSYGYTTFDCGFCDQHTPCVCREIAMQQAAAESIEAQNHLSSLTMSDFEQKPFIIHDSTPTILDNLPAYQPPVALRRRTTNKVVAPIFPVFAPSAAPVVTDAEAAASATKPANCSGDPSNCGACAGDTFGQAFCAAIGESVATQAPCTECPCSPDDLSTISSLGGSGGCCGDSSKCGSGHLTRVVPADPEASSAVAQKIPTNDAWNQLKAHPNVAFADLSLLADVVSRRSRCTGPRVVNSPEPERPPSPSASGTGTRQYRTVQGTDSHSVPKLVPEDVLMQCGRRRVREVHASGVRDALRLLDAQFK